MAMEIRPAPVRRVVGNDRTGPGLTALAPIVALLLVVTAAWAGGSLDPQARPGPSSASAAGDEASGAHGVERRRCYFFRV